MTRTDEALPVLGGPVWCFLPEKSDQYRWQTDLPAIFEAIEGCEEAYAWLLVDPEAWAVGEGTGDMPPELLSDQQTQWLTGIRLKEILHARPFQLGWGRLLAYPPAAVDDVHADEIPPPEPYIGLRPTDPLAVLEILAFDNTHTEIFTRDQDLARRLGAYFPAGDCLEPSD